MTLRPFFITPLSNLVSQSDGYPALGGFDAGKSIIAGIPSSPQNLGVLPIPSYNDIYYVLMKMALGYCPQPSGFFSTR